MNSQSCPVILYSKRNIYIYIIWRCHCNRLWCKAMYFNIGIIIMQVSLMVKLKKAIADMFAWKNLIMSGCVIDLPGFGRKSCKRKLIAWVILLIYSLKWSYYNTKIKRWNYIRFMQSNYIIFIYFSIELENWDVLAKGF